MSGQPAVTRARIPSVQRHAWPVVVGLLLVAWVYKPARPILMTTLGLVLIYLLVTGADEIDRFIGSVLDGLAGR
jgi:hypothetical protein